MAQGETFYFIERLPGFGVDGTPKTINTEEKDQYEPKLVASLKTLYSQRGQGWKSLEEFTKDVADNPAIGRAIGYSVRSATDAEVKAEPTFAIFDALERFDNAEMEAKRIQREALVEIVKWLDENIKTAEDLTGFYKTQGRNNRQLQAWARQVRREHTLSDEFIQLYSQHTKDNRSSAAKKKPSVREIADDFYPKETDDKDK